MINEPTGFGILSALVFLPALGALLLLFVPELYSKAIKGLGIFFALATFGLSLYVYGLFQPGTYHMQLVEFVPWIQGLGIHYRLGVDGISIWLLLLTTFLTFISAWFSWYVQHRVKAYFVLLLLLETAMLGVFVSLDMILFYTFFESSLVPMYFLISIWGGARRRYAAVKFFLYTFLGSIFMLIGMVFLAILHQRATGVLTFDLMAIQNAVAEGTLWTGAVQTQALLFWAFSLSLIIKCPMFPFHTWLPDAHVEAPTAGSVILAGVLLKMGSYGFLRFSLPLFPEAIQQMPNATVVPIMVLAVIGIIYGALVSAVQPDVKKLIAYSSVAHMGFVVLGIFALTHTGLMGGTLQGLNHGISTGALFLLVGLIYERTHSRLFKDYGGLKAQMPIFAALFLIVTLSSLGLPGTNGFVGEFLALLGAFEAAYHGMHGLHWSLAAIAAAGVILAAVYLLVMFMKVFYGPKTNPALSRLRDLKPWETVMVGLLVVFVFWGGLYPNTFLKPMEASLGAVRLMALNDPGQRPSWSDLSLEVDERGDLVRVTPRERGGDLENYTVLERVAPARLFTPLEKPEEGQAQVGGQLRAERGGFGR